MPRAGFGTHDQTSASLFKFEEGRGEITNIEFYRGEGQFNADKLVMAVYLQRKDRDGRPKEEEVVKEELNVGPIIKFHPGKASGPDDEGEDLGEDNGVVGNCLYSMSGAGPDKKAKISVFGSSLEEAGVRPALLNGYGPYLIGIDADWCQFITGEKMAGAKNDPTCLTVKKGGTIYNLSEINKRVGGTSAPAQSSKLQPQGKTNAAAAPTPTEGEDDDTITTKARKLMVELPGKAEQKVPAAKFGPKVTVLMAKAALPPKTIKALQNKFRDDAWIKEQAESFGWTVEGDTVVIPAA